MRLLLQLLQRTNDNKTQVDSDEQIESRLFKVEHLRQSDASCSNHSTLYGNEDEEGVTVEKQFLRKRTLSEGSNDDKSEIKKSYTEIEESSNEFQDDEDPLTGVSTRVFEIEETPSIVQRTPPRPSDHYESFGTYIASLLRSLPPKKALILQPKIVKMIVAVGVEDLSDSKFDIH